MPDNGDIEWDADEVMDSLKKVKGRIDLAAGGALMAVGFDIMGESIKKTPVEFGQLRQSNYVTQPNKVGGGWVVEMGYGVKYAPTVHESPGTLKGEPREPSPPHRGNYWDSGEPKFMQKAIDENIGRAPKVFKGIFWKVMRGKMRGPTRPSDTPEKPQTDGED